MTNQFRILLLVSVLVLTGCVPVNQKPESAATDATTSQSSSMNGEISAEMSAFEFEKFFQELASLDEAGRAGRLEAEKMPQSAFRARAIEVYGSTMPSIAFLENEVSSSATISALAILSKFGLFTEFQSGVPAPTKSLEGLAYALEAVELRAGEAVVVKYWSEFVEPKVIATKTPTPNNPATPSTFTVEFFPSSSLRFLEDYRGEELYLVPVGDDGGFKVWQFSVRAQTVPATNALCRIMQSDKNLGKGYYGWEQRTDKAGKATLYSYKIDWNSVLAPKPSVLSPWWVRCSKGDFFADSPKFALRRG